MLFNSLVFIFWFLPIVFFVNLVLKKRLSNYWLAAASLLFYFFGESQYTYIFIISVVVNYLFGLLIDRSNLNTKKFIFIAGIIFNVLLLGHYKYYNFIIGGINNLIGLTHGQALPNEAVHLPIGISFFTFEAIAYLVDLYTKKAKAIKNPVDLLLYMGIFPHLIAGPVIRYVDLEEQLHNRAIDINNVSYGIKRFIIGLGKKVIIANGIGQIADTVFGNQAQLNGANVFWIGLIAYGLQLYFDFSGYSDMAISLGKMLGFTFIENFNYPYISKNVQEFWRRWNISLGLWFKNYVYIPLGGSRVPFWRNLFNLFVVFFLTGLWHGAGLNFIVWGLLSWVCIVAEKLFLSKLFDRLGTKLGSFVSHIYLLFVIFIGWVFFRSENFANSVEFIKKLFSFTFVDAGFLFNRESVLIFVLGIILAFPFFRDLVEWLKQKVVDRVLIATILRLIANVSYVVLFAVCIGYIITGTYNPFIYFRF